MSNTPESDPLLVIMLPTSQWQTIVAHLQAGTYQIVAPVLQSIEAQAALHIEANREAAAKAEAAQIESTPQMTDSSSTGIERIH